MGTGIMLLIQALVVGIIFTGVLGFFLVRYLSSSTQQAVSRLNRETEDVRAKQTELNEKIKQANEELQLRRKEADALTSKMAEDAQEKAKKEREDILKKSRTEAEDIINKAQHTKDDLRKAIEKEVEMKALDFNVVLLREVLSDKSLKALDESLISEFIESLNQIDMDMISDVVMTAEVCTGTPLDPKFKNRLSDVLQKRLGRTITISDAIDKKVISGMILRFGSLKLDGSLRSSLQERGTEIKEKLEKGVITLEEA